jgi:PAS domain S-box-containing protein
MLDSALLVAFIPHGHCYLWKPELVGLHITSDSLIALAYYSIPTSLFHFVRKRQDLPFSWAFLLFAAFIIACGTTHLMEIWTLWHPTYWLAGALKLVTALTSLATAIVLLPLLPKALALSSPNQLKEANQNLEREIAERKQVEAALRESEEKYRLLFSNELDAVSLFDVETGQFLDVNEAFEELYGYNRAEALQLKALDVSAEPAQSQAAIQLANSTGKARIYLRWHRKKNGTVFPVELCAGRFTLNDRPVMCAASRDITDRQRVEAALRESEERFRLLLQDLQVGVLVQGLHTEVLLSNPKALELLGLTEDQLLGKTSFDPSWNVIREDGTPFPAYLRPVPQAIATGKPMRDVVMGVYRPEPDDRIWLLVHAEPQFNEQGTVKQVICTFDDITTRKVAEEALKQEHELLQTIVDHVPAMLAFFDPRGRVQWVNQAWEKTLGWSAEELQHRNVLTELYPDPLDRRLVKNFIQSATGKWQDFKAQTRQGKVIDTAWANVQLSNGSSIGIGKDITERKQAEAALRLADFSFERSAVAAIWIARDARILRVNDGSCQMLGYSRDELQSMYVYDVDPNFSAADWADHWKILQLQKTLTFVTQLRNKAGTLVPIETTLNYLEFNGEEYNFAFARDISDRLQAEAALQQKAERERLVEEITWHIRQSLDLNQILTTAVAEVREFIQSDRVVIYSFDPDWNGSIVAESVRSSHLSILHQSIYDPCFAAQWHTPYQEGQISTLEDADTATLHPCYRELLRGLQVRANIVVPILHGDRLWGLLIVHYCLEPHPWQEWEIDLLRQLTNQLAIAVQQAELHQQVQQLNADLELQVQERTAQLQQALNFETVLKRITDQVRDSLDEAKILQTAVEELALTLGVESCDAALYNADLTTSKITYEYNRSLPSALNREFLIAESSNPAIYTQIFQGQYCQFCFTVPISVRFNQERYAGLACPMSDDQGILGDLWLYKASHEWFNELEIRLVQQVANQCAIALRQSRLYQAAQAQVEELERLNRLKDDFLSTVSHELRTPVSSIKMAAQMLEIILKPLGVLDPKSGSASRYFQILQCECQREIRLINDLLDLSRLDAETEPLMPTHIELGLWIRHLLEPFEERMRCQQQRLHVEIPAQLPTLTTDLGYLERVLTELFNNACKYTPSGETISVATTVTADGLQLKVSNSGVEIPAGELSHVFEKFYRVPSLDPWKHGGTGLGLALVKRRVEQLQGKIAVTSEQGWTTFTIALPWELSAC